MNKSKSDQELREKLRVTASEIMQVLNKSNLNISETCALLGGVFATFAPKSEENTPFLSFFYSFGNTLDALYSSEQSSSIKEKDST
jgi:hypothetical protein